jgi:hypothetical protein
MARLAAQLSRSIGDWIKAFRMPADDSARFLQRSRFGRNRVYFRLRFGIEEASCKLRRLVGEFGSPSETRRLLLPNGM